MINLTIRSICVSLTEPENTSVVSQASKRLKAHFIILDKFTTIDPHIQTTTDDVHSPAH